MSDPVRPDPDLLVAQLQRASRTARRGALKVFFGMCPGVGKTYAMLQAARQKQSEGSEVVVGLVETHGRCETEALLDGLPILPRHQLEYRGTILEEMDLDALLLWHPRLAVVDEMAHTNATGSRHPKRYQDVIELLDAGIDVFTTLNVQHIESRRDTVQQITGVLVRETVPDSVLDAADEVVLVDLTPEQLRGRLAQGKVYLGERAAAAAENFFRESNLTALREMSLRLVAEHVDRDLRGLMQEQRIAGPWKSGDRLLVGVRGSLSSEKLIRYTRRLAATMEASWIVANIELPAPLSAGEQAQLTKCLSMARQLGAEVISTPGFDVGEALLRLARQHNVTQIVLGKPLQNRWAHWFGRRSPVDRMIRHSGEIDLHMIRSEETPARPRLRFEERFATAPWNEFGIALSIVAAVTAVCLLVSSYTGYWAVALFYLLTVVLAGTRLRRWPTMFLAAASAVLWNMLFIPPRFTFRISHFHDFVMFGAYFVIALVIGNLTTRLREREKAERRREERATSLYQLTRALAASSSLDEALKQAVPLVEKSFDGQVAIWLTDHGELAFHVASTMPFSEKEESVASWAFQKKQPAGMSTDTLPEAEALHLPLVAAEQAVGVLAVRFPRLPTLEQRELLDAFAAQLVVFVNKERALQQSRAVQLATQSQKLQKTLFDSVSHELKTPLAAISVALDQPEPNRAELHQAVRRLTRTVDHLLDATRLESGALQLRREWSDPVELLREAVALAALEQREVVLQAPEELPEILVDGRLIQQALVTLLANADSYSPAGEPIAAEVARNNGAIVFSVADRGTGLARGEETRVFEKFYRGPGKPTGGLGLGLAVARHLVEAHGGAITACNAPGGGALFQITLRLGEPMQLPPETAA
ncbi:MAG: DUF4118 domain-containing protein [Chthoniobacterales bacterium]